MDSFLEAVLAVLSELSVLALLLERLMWSAIACASWISLYSRTAELALLERSIRRNDFAVLHGEYQRRKLAPM